MARSNSLRLGACELVVSCLLVVVVSGSFGQQPQADSTDERAAKLETRIERLLRDLNAARRELAALRGERLPGGELYYDVTAPPKSPANPATDRNQHFAFTDVKYGDTKVGIRVVGRVTNNSGATWKLANFQLAVLDSQRRLLGVTPVLVTNLADGESKDFSALATIKYQSGLRFQFYPAASLESSDVQPAK